MPDPAVTRTVAVWESGKDLTDLSPYGSNFCIALPVVDSTGKAGCDMVWKSLPLAPRTTIEWEPVYSLNWTPEIPKGNVPLFVGGAWQECAEGQIFDIDDKGAWQPSSEAPRAGYLTVGKNSYKPSTISDIHIVVGVKSIDGSILPIYADRAELKLGGSSWYKPQEQVEWWYQKDAQTSSMISGGRSNVGGFDLTNPQPTTNRHYVSTTFTRDPMNQQWKWLYSPNPPPPFSITGVLGGSVDGLSAMRAFNGTNNGKKITLDLDSLTETLKGLLETINGMKALENNRYPVQMVLCGTIQWPEPKTLLAGMAAAALVASSLMTHRYLIKASKPDPKDSQKWTIIFAPIRLQDSADEGPPVPEPIKADWETALAADSKDQATNGGLEILLQDSF